MRADIVYRKICYTFCWLPMGSINYCIGTDVCCSVNKETESSERRDIIFFSHVFVSQTSIRSRGGSAQRGVSIIRAFQL